MLTSAIHFLFINHIFGCVGEENSIIFSTEIHSNKVRRGSGDGQDDVFLGRKVEWDASHSQLAGEQQELPHSYR